MNTQSSKLYFRILVLAFLVIVISACSSAPTSVPDEGSTPTETPTSAAPLSLKLGHWASENEEPGEAIVSFHLSDAVNIGNFEMTASFGTPTQTCMIELDQLKIQVNDDGTFVISYSMEYEDVAEALGPAVMSLGVIPEGQPYEVLHIDGNVTDTTMDGTYEISVCSHTLYLADNTGPWKVQWQNP